MLTTGRGRREANMDRLVANSLEHLRASDAELLTQTRLHINHGATKFALKKGEFVALAIGDEYAYAASLPTRDGILRGFEAYAMNQRLSNVSDDQYRAMHFEKAKQDAITKAHRQFGHVDTAPLAAVFHGMAPPDPSFKPPRNVPKIMKMMVNMIRSEKAEITGSRRSDAILKLDSEHTVTLSIITPTFDEYSTYKIPGVRITVSNNNKEKPDATYTALLPNRKIAQTLYLKLRQINREIDGVLMMNLFGEESDPNANMFTDEVIDYFITHTAHVGEEHFVRAVLDNYSQFGLVDDQFGFNQQQKMAALGSIKKTNKNSTGVIQALRNWGYDRGRHVFSGFADMAAM